MKPDPKICDNKILIGGNPKLTDQPYRYLSLAFGNRHGLISGATGSGKTVTLQVLAEGFSNAGVSVFLADVKGDLAGLSQAGDSKPVFVARAKDLGLEYNPDRFPVVFWDVFDCSSSFLKRGGGYSRGFLLVKGALCWWGF